ncbi:trehalase-domain-containing protein [Neoconidiobolus thromboides FSU 785]|nr:trehalase-domain-containing protein [Neoconidiobolus thromboides FSU 785]
MNNQRKEDQLHSGTSSISILNPNTAHVTAPANEYYSRANNSPTIARNRTLSMSNSYTSLSRPGFHNDYTENKFRRQRRGSIDDKTLKPMKFLLDVEETSRLILAQEDTDGDFQITINDSGPKVLKVGTANSGGFKKYDIRGTYMLSNLLQELALARDLGRKHIVLDEARLNENPVDRLNRMIKFNFWDGLTRAIDEKTLEVICNDPKDRSKNPIPRVYVPYDDIDAFNYYSKIANKKPELNLLVEKLPKDITPTYVKSINHQPGILSLGLRKIKNSITGEDEYKGIPFVVPGGRFNEMYGWDSYFESLGLIIDGKYELAKDMVDNFVYQIRHYGKILNANRSYYLTRSQPPFLTDMALRVYECLDKTNPESKKWLATVMRAAIKEYYTVWMSSPRFDPKSGLSRFYPTGIGMPPETESTHFNHLMEPFAKQLNMEVEEYKILYDNGTIKCPKLDHYFIHDRAVRESGHDTTYRLEKKCADIATIDLNCLLYKYEIDIEKTIREIFENHLPMHSEDGLEFDNMIAVETSEAWKERAEYRHYLIDKYCWNEEKGMYFDYNTEREQQSVYESVTALWTLWAGCIDEDKAEVLIETCLNKFEVTGGLVCGTEESRGMISLERPNRQWDYPFGWAPHQIMAWQGLENYGYSDIAKRLAYRWLYTIVKSFVDFNGVVPEKFDIVSMTHQVKVEYGNVGVDFKFVPREGFGWMNASFQTGLEYLNSHMRRALGTLTPPDQFFHHLNKRFDSNLYRTLSHSAKVIRNNRPTSTTNDSLNETISNEPQDTLATSPYVTPYNGSSLASISEAFGDLELNEDYSNNKETFLPDESNSSLPKASQLVKVFAEISHISSPSRETSPFNTPRMNEYDRLTQISLDEIPEDIDEELWLELNEPSEIVNPSSLVNKTHAVGSPSSENSSENGISIGSLKRNKLNRNSSNPLSVETKFISVQDGEVICSPQPTDPMTSEFHTHHRQLRRTPSHNQ